MNIPVLILAFNRPNETRYLLEKLSIIKPSKIYISQDGPRKNIKRDINLCNEVKKILKEVNWNCEVKYKINKNNLGCRISVSSAISWLFENEDVGIILEDDCIPSQSFFKFCQKMLNKYEKNNEIFVISGSNFQKNKFIGDGDYYFSKYAHCWGWATWKRAWYHYDDSMKFWNNFKEKDIWKKIHKNNLERKYWERIFNNVKNKKIDSWAYVWLASVWNFNGITITPNINLISNIGFNKDATNTLSAGKNSDFTHSKEFKNDIKDPGKIIINTEADEFVFNNHFNGKYNFWPWRLLYLLKILMKDPKTFYLRLKKYLT